MTTRQAADIQMLLDALDKAHLIFSRFLEPGGKAETQMREMLATLDNDTLLAARTRLEQDVAL